MNHSIPMMGDTRVIFQTDRYCLLASRISFLSPSYLGLNDSHVDEKLD